MVGKTIMSAINKPKGPGKSIKKMVADRKRKKQILKSGGGKYAMPVRYELRKDVKKIKEAIGDVVGSIKGRKDSKRQMQDSSGKTSRNSSATCGPKGCGKIGGKQ
jgi:hypothetical protein